MSLDATKKASLISEHGQNATDTGSSEVQIALLTADINKLTDHFKVHAKDHHSRRGLIRKVNLRRKLLAYLKNRDLVKYQELIAKLKIRG